MTCKTIEGKISQYLDGELPLNEVAQMKNHIETCEACHTLFEDMKLMKEFLSGMPQLELPEGFEAELHDKLVEASAEMTSALKLDKDQRQESHKNDNVRDLNSRRVIKIALPSWKDFARHSKVLTGIAATVLIGFLAYGAGNVRDYMPESMDQAVYESRNQAPELMMVDEAEVRMEFNEGASFDTGGDTGSSNFAVSSEPQAKTKDIAKEPAVFAEAGDVAPTPESVGDSTAYIPTIESRMIIYTANIGLDIVNYDETYEKLTRMVSDMGGYISDANTSYKYYDEFKPEKSLKHGQITIRIPQERFMGAVEHLESIGIQKNLNIWSRDITSQYRDIANEVANLEIREAKLGEIMEEAEAIEDVITVERELSRVRGEINGYMGTLKEWEQLVDLSTIHIDLNEVETLEPQIRPIDKTLLQKARDGFVNSINQLKFLGESIFIGSIALFPKLLVWIILFFIGYRIVQWIRKKIKK